MVRSPPPRVPSAAPLRLRSELLRTLTTLDREIEQGLGHGVFTPDEIHDIHREMRRLASGLSLWARVVSPRHKEGVQELTRRVRRLARLVGRVRDQDVTTTLLAGIGKPPVVSDDLHPWHEFLSRFREDTHTGRELLRAFLRSERQGGLFERARGLVELVPRADATRGLHRILAEERRRRQGKVRKAHRKARRDPTSERLHRLRIRIRQWRHFATLEATAHAPAGQPPPPSWRRLQARLGRLHDLDVALGTVPEELSRTDPAQRLRDKRRKLRRLVSANLDQIASAPKKATARARLRGPP